MMISNVTKWIALSVFTIGLVVACGSQKQSESKNVFGIDNREKVVSLSSPYDAVGRLDEAGCTATLVGRSLILTAAHCLWNETSHTSSRKEHTFSLAVRDGKPLAQAKVLGFWLGSEDPESKRVTDFAVVRLDKDLSAYGQPLTLQQRPNEEPQFTTNLIAYSDDFANGGSPSVHRNCKVMERDGGRWFHECDGKRGMSGGPLVDVQAQKPLLVGISVSEFRGGAPDSVSVPEWSKERSNVAVSATQFSELVSNAVAQFDGNDNPGTTVSGYKYYSMKDLNDGSGQLPEPVPPPTPPTTPTPATFQGNWDLTDSTGLFLLLPHQRMSYLNRTLNTLNYLNQNTSGLKTNLDNRFGTGTSASYYLYQAAHCIARMQYLVSLTSQTSQGYQADREIREKIYPCVQGNLKAGYESWENLTQSDESSRALDVSFFNGIFTGHRFVFIDLYGVRRDIL